jgi:hypothetical protein
MAIDEWNQAAGVAIRRQALRDLGVFQPFIDILDLNPNALASFHSARLSRFAAGAVLSRLQDAIDVRHAAAIKVGANGSG